MEDCVGGLMNVLKYCPDCVHYMSINSENSKYQHKIKCDLGWCQHLSMLPQQYNNIFSDYVFSYLFTIFLDLIV